MNPYYYNELPTQAMDEETAVIIGLVFFGIMGVILLCGLIGWILGSVGLHKVAKRRGIRNAWLAWLPIGNHWILGCVSDQYQHLIQGKVTSRRKFLLGLNLAAMVLGIAYLVAAIVVGIAVEVEGGPEELMLVLLGCYLLMIAATITLMVFYHICNYDFYRSCRPNSAVVFLVLGIFLPVCQPFFYFACRKKDLGFVIPEPVAPESPELPGVNPEF